MTIVYMLYDNFPNMEFELICHHSINQNLYMLLDCLEGLQFGVVKHLLVLRLLESLEQQDYLKDLLVFEKENFE